MVFLGQAKWWWLVYINFFQDCASHCYSKPATSGGFSWTEALFKPSLKTCQYKAGFSQSEKKLSQLFLPNSSSFNFLTFYLLINY